MAATTLSPFFQDEILPGVLTEIEQSYNRGDYATNWGGTASVMIMGTAFNGPMNTPIKVYSPEHAAYIFGGSYDAETKHEASLITGITDAYAKGCRAIYAVRVSGKEIYKDFNIAPVCDYKLRVSGKFPTNANKDVYMYFDKTYGAMKLVIYKPTSRATITESVNGIIDSEKNTIAIQLDLTNTYSYTLETPLVSLIELVNNNSLNNVITLSIVDAEGNDVTTAPEVKDLPLEAMFNGLYMIGRNATAGSITTDVDYKISKGDAFWSDYKDYKLYRTLALNTDVNAAYPINGSFDALRRIFPNVATTSKFDFIADVETVNTIFAKDDVDYDEVDVSGFDLYKKLGCGYAVTAKIELKREGIENPTAKDYVVKETPLYNNNRTVPILDGVYSLLQNVPSDYRVLVAGNANDSLINRLPTKDEFLAKVAGSATAIKDAEGNTLIEIAPIVTADTKISDKTYSINFKVIADDEAVKFDDIADLCLNDSVKAINAVDDIANANFALGEVFAVVADGTAPSLGIMIEDGARLLDANDIDLDGHFFFLYDSKQVVKFDAASASAVVVDYATLNADGKEYFIVSYDNVNDVYKMAEDGTVTGIGNLVELLDDENPGMYTLYANSASADVYEVKLTESYITSNTVIAFVDELNASALGSVFSFALNSDYSAYAEMFLDADEIAFAGVTTDPALFAKEIYDTSKYIPYKTTDNLARQLAQHATYTSIKTHPTHGIIGFDKITNTSIAGIAAKVNEAYSTDFVMYAKRNNGSNMLGRDQMPYDIGRNISIVFGPTYYVTAPDSYSYVTNGAAGYAGMVSILPLNQSSTNQPIDVNNTIFNLTETQLRALTTAGFITLNNSYTRGIVVSDGITFAPSTSEFKRLSTARILNNVEWLIREAAEPFIGQLNSLATRNSIITAIKSNLNKIVGSLINDYSFAIVSNDASHQIGIIDIDYVVVPFYEIRQIRNRITVSDSLQ